MRVNPIDYLIALFSPMMRSTIELSKLNQLWEMYNNGLFSSCEIIWEVEKRKWKYHSEKARLLKSFAESFAKLRKKV